MDNTLEQILTRLYELAARNDQLRAVNGRMEKRVKELEAELAAARKAAEGGGDGEYPQ